MQVEWSKTKARSDHWDKEYVLTVEEMRCILEYCDWKAGWWTQRASLRTDVSVALQSGLHMHTSKRLSITTSLDLLLESGTHL